MIDRARHTTFANVRNLSILSIQQRRILLTPGVNRPRSRIRYRVSAVAAIAAIAHGSARTEPCADFLLLPAFFQLGGRPRLSLEALFNWRSRHVCRSGGHGGHANAGDHLENLKRRIPGGRELLDIRLCHIPSLFDQGF